MRYRIAHKTDYGYSTPVAQSNHLLHLSPCTIEGQTIEKHEIVISPTPANRHDFSDYFNNPVIHLTIEEYHKLLSIHACTIVTVERDQTELLKLSQLPWESVRDAMSDADHVAEAEFTCYSNFTQPTAEIAAYGAQSFAPGRAMMDAVLDLTRRIHEDFDYDATATDVFTPVTQVFKQKSGVCQDFAHFELTCLRALGLPARYVSGYLRTYPPEGQPRLVGADASHAWISAWCPEAGWIDFDPTNNKVISDEHITLTIGRDFGDVSPISGIILGGGNHIIDVSVDVMPIDENGNEIGSSSNGQMQQAMKPSSPALSPPLPQSQGPVEGHVQEQSQSQTSDQIGPVKPVAADRTY
ncbi:transglutaminase family protein [uncultured Cohaesibacter sp.]|uniref:transglutaminase family protein n=1 Tax=uncultured Cohaesibacter sp. TaxID=1002546 RepID=UPI00293035F8|nr:transglutaminase family protein [uncultured Cohaesibacter sp.]